MGQILEPKIATSPQFHEGESVNMGETESRQCAHEPCQCMVSAGEKYCSDFCENAGSEEVEIACECGHEPCA
jgi:hypothetical protein